LTKIIGPNYPNFYPSNEECHFIITGKIKTTFIYRFYSKISNLFLK
jgi:hypothetical protein